MAINLTLRGTKGSALTYQEVDANFTSIKDAVDGIQVVDTSSFVTNSQLSSTLTNYVTSSSLNTTLGNYATTSSLGAYATTSSLGAYVTTSTAQSISGTKTFRGIQETVYDWGTVSGTLAPDATSGTIQTMVINGAITINTLTNAVAGQSVTLKIKQDATGGRTLSSTMKFAGGSKTLSTSSNAIDIINITYDGQDMLASLVKGFA